MSTYKNRCFNTITLPVLLFAIFYLISPVSNAAGSIESFEFDNAQKEDVFHDLTKQLRCPKCQNQNISDSNAELAKDMRNKTYELVQSGQSKDQVIDYMVARYGNFVRYDPPMTPATIFLWLGPLLFIMFGVWFLFRLSKRSNEQDSSFDELESQRLKDILEKETSSNKES
ncbi:MAG: cytochrome c-type biogenesis protein [Psychromonas sp.]